MDSLAEYYHLQGGGSNVYSDDLFGHAYVGSPYVQRLHGIGTFLAGISCSETSSRTRPSCLRPRGCQHGAHILADIGARQPETKVKDIVADRLCRIVEENGLETQGLRTKTQAGDGCLSSKESY